MSYFAMLWLSVDYCWTCLRGDYIVRQLLYIKYAVTIIFIPSLPSSCLTSPHLVSQHLARFANFGWNFAEVKFCWLLLSDEQALSLRPLSKDKIIFYTVGLLDYFGEFYHGFLEDWKSIFNLQILDFFADLFERFHLQTQPDQNNLIDISQI